MENRAIFSQLTTLVADLIELGLVIDGFTFSNIDGEWVMRINNTSVRFMNAGTNGAYVVSALGHAPQTCVIGNDRLRATQEINYYISTH